MSLTDQTLTAKRLTVGTYVVATVNYNRIRKGAIGKIVSKSRDGKGREIDVCYYDAQYKKAKWYKHCALLYKFDASRLIWRKATPKEQQLYEELVIEKLI